MNIKINRRGANAKDEIAWSFLFSGLQLPLAGLIDIIILWIAIAFTILSSHKISVIAGILLIPYILWVSYARVLNFLLWHLNS